MTEINGKKYYTWDEIQAMPLGTKFRLGWWKGKDPEYLFFERDNDSFIGLLDQTRKDFPKNDTYAELAMLTNFYNQDRFEIAEELKPKREYVDGPDALRKLMTDEWKKIACDQEDWKKRNDCLTVTFSGLDLVGSDCVYEGLSPELLKLKRWYEYKD